MGWRVVFRRVGRRVIPIATTTETISEMRAAGKSFAKIADHYGVSPTSIERIAKNFDQKAYRAALKRPAQVASAKVSSKDARQLEAKFLEWLKRRK